MLKLKKLYIENFGPYYGTSQLEFSSQNGITIIWGLNGMGKTSLLNCFRFVMWGTIYNRNKEVKELWKFVNNNAVKEGKSMKITLDMNYDGFDYTLTRIFERNGGDGLSDSHYIMRKFLTKDGEALSSDEINHFLNNAFPQKISRFYLFDGELLSEYEVLLDSSQASNDKIKKSIEDILGLPILENSINSVRVGANRSKQDADKAAQADEITKNDAVTLEKMRQKLIDLQSSYKDLTEEIQKFKDELEDVNQIKNDTAAYLEKLEKIKALESTLSSYEGQATMATDVVKPLIDKLWLYELKSSFNDIISKIRSEVEILDTKRTDYLTSTALSNFLTKAISQNGETCPICKIGLNDSHKEHINSFINELRSCRSLSVDESDKLNYLHTEINFFNQKQSNLDINSLIANWNQLNTLRSRIDLNKIKITDLNAEKSKLKVTLTDEEALSLETKARDLEKKIDVANTALQKNKQEQDITENDIQRLEAKIKKSGSSSSAAIYKKSDFYKEVLDILVKSIEKFREKLKINVEKDASEIFNSIAHAPNYSGLKINDNYGLEIIDKNGEIVPNRSSGYEQVVAISLIGSLHRNTPIAGPIFMDSTFQRIDSKHKDNVIKTLPKLASQVIVLAYPEEFSRLNAIEELKENLVLEKDIIEMPDGNHIINNHDIDKNERINK